MQVPSRRSFLFGSVATAAVLAFAPAMAAITPPTLSAAQIRSQWKTFLGLPRINVMTDSGAASNGSTNDQPFIQAAVNAIDALGGGTIYFPKGTGNYLLNSSVTFESGGLDFKFEFEPGAKLIGNFADALLKRSVNSPIGGVHLIENGIFEQNHASGTCVKLHSCVAVKAVLCNFHGPGASATLAHHGIETFNSQAATLDTCMMIGCGIGAVAGNATMVLDCDITGCIEGVRHQNLGLTILGGRFEVNRKAIVLGLDENGNGFTSAGAFIAGLSMESNGWALFLAAAANVKMAACPITGAQTDMHGGILGGTATEVSIDACGLGFAQPLVADGDGKRGGIVLENINNSSFQNINISIHSNDAARQWLVQYPRNNKFINCPQLSEVSELTADSQMNGTRFKNVRMTSASAIGLFFRNDTAMGSDGGALPMNEDYCIIQGGAGAVTIATDGGSPPTLITPGGRNRLTTQGSVGFVRRIAANTFIAHGSGWTT